MRDEIDNLFGSGVGDILDTSELTVEYLRRVLCNREIRQSSPTVLPRLLFDEGVRLGFITKDDKRYFRDDIICLT